MEVETITNIILEKLKEKGEVKMKEFVEELKKETNSSEKYIYNVIWALRKSGKIGEKKKGKYIYLFLS